MHTLDVSSVTFLFCVFVCLAYKSVVYEVCTCNYRLLLTSDKEKIKNLKLNDIMHKLMMCHLLLILYRNVVPIPLVVLLRVYIFYQNFLNGSITLNF